MFTDLFEAAEARAQRETGLDRVESTQNAKEWIAQCRQYAVWHANYHGEVSSDDVIMRYPRPEGVHANATGAVFRTKLLRIVGYRQSTKISSHARRIAIFAPA